MSKPDKALIAGLTDTLADAQGGASGLPEHAVEAADVRAIRRKLHMSQHEFATAYRIPLPTLKNWEQGRRRPDAPTTAYLLTIARLPAEVSAVLSRDP